ncbi:EscU/YscU/HrcU family type III secretion system export apparatus switch protein [Sphingomonas phyllosphaerae]|uniref:EscU/YscU/HrcU family type III secretion system export apparatus switch protein n=1 Tax=Sphingomonas phyllosphaerae TaxID=257003 RepID=UPI0024138BEF|nr:flagellar type III secretion system protein FlhB [Sphingomonas phyllosphaerae]
MADAEQSQKTEEPTDRRLEEARRRGERAVTGEVRHAAIAAAALTLTGTVGAMVAMHLARLFVRLWGAAQDYPLEPRDAPAFARGFLAETGWALAPIAAVLVVAALLAAVIQARPSLSWTRVAPRWSKVSPGAGFKRMFGTRGLVEFLKTLAKSCFVAVIAFAGLWPHVVAFDQLVDAAPDALLHAAVGLVAALLRWTTIALVALALADAVYQRRAFLRGLRMTRQEVMDEHKDSEGDPRFKARRRAIALQRARRRMIAAVKQSTVVVTNPTHYAVALKYEVGDQHAPLVVAKGVDALAQRIREAAQENGVPIVESPPLARALFASAELDRPIPVDHYAAVAEIIAYVVRLSRSRRSVEKRGDQHPAGGGRIL